MSMQQYCLRWNNHQPNFISVFSSLLNSESLVDVTLAAEGRHLQAHKVVLSACSSYFQSLFTINPCQHPIVILKDVKFADLKVMVDFMYYGEVNVSQEQLPHILKTAEMLKIKGLAEIPVDQSVTKNQTSTVDRAELLASGDPNWSTDPTRPSLSPSPACPLSPASKRKRMRKSSTGSASGSGDRGDENTGEVTLTSNASAATLSTVIKTDPGFATANSAMPKGNTKQHNTNTGVDLARGATHDTIESTDMPHQVTLVINQQVPQDVSVQHNLETTSSIDVAGSSTVTSISGMQWSVMDQSAYTHYASSCTPSPPSSNTASTAYTQCPTPNSINPQQQQQQQQQQQAHQQQQQQTAQATATTAPGTGATNATAGGAPHSGAYHINHHHHLHHAATTPAPTPHHLHPHTTQHHHQHLIQKRKRSINPQGDENFIRALEAVRFGGIGFCKAAKMYGVNNRTLWLEYKKRGYPNFRLSIKSRKQEPNVGDNAVSNSPGGPSGVDQQQQQQAAQQSTSHHPKQEPQQQAQQPDDANNHPVALISGAFYESKHSVAQDLLQQRQKYLDGASIITAQQGIHFQGINFEQM